MEGNILIQSPVSLQRRRLSFAGGALLLLPSLALAGAQREEILSDDTASVVRGSINNVNPPWLVFVSAQEGERWLSVMSSHLIRYVPDEGERRHLSVNIQHEASRIGLDPQVVPGPIEVESVFRRYTTSGVGTHGLIQVVPFWKNYIDKPSHNFFDIHTDLRYGCTILRHYDNLENGDPYRVLACFNGGLGSGKYPNIVLGVWRDRWWWG